MRKHNNSYFTVKTVLTQAQTQARGSNFPFSFARVCACVCAATWTSENEILLGYNSNTTEHWIQISSRLNSTECLEDFVLLVFALNLFLFGLSQEVELPIPVRLSPRPSRGTILWDSQSDEFTSPSWAIFIACACACTLRALWTSTYLHRACFVFLAAILNF